MPTLVAAQQVVVSTPFQTIGDSFYESNGINFGFDNGAIRFQQGPPPIPQFGGYDPNAGANFGFSIRGPGGAMNFGISLGQGSSRSISTTTPTVVVPNGGTAMLFDGSLRPFVTGFVPVVGSAGIGFPAPTPIPPAWTRSYVPGQPIPSDAENRRLGRQAAAAANQPSPKHQPSSAEHGDISVAEIRRRQLAEDAALEAEYMAILTAARVAEEAGDLQTALSQYDDLRRQLDKKDRTAVEDHIRSLRLRIKQSTR